MSQRHSSTKSEKEDAIENLSNVYSLLHINGLVFQGCLYEEIWIIDFIMLFVYVLLT